MHPIRRSALLVPCCITLFLSLAAPASAATVCVRAQPHPGCYASIQAAVNHAAAGDVVRVGAGTYKEFVTIGIPIAIAGEDAESTTIDATGLPHGIFIDGVSHAGLNHVTISGLTVVNALYEGILVVSANHVTIRNNRINNNDTSPGLNFTGATTGCPGQPGTGIYENDETGDCGGALHLVGVSFSTVSDNFITGNADGVLISDETAASHDNVLTHNTVQNNPLECGIVLASHPPSGHTAPPFATHFGITSNTIAENVSSGNGVQIGGSGVGLFSDGMGMGTVSGNLIIHNRLIGNGIGGVNIHTHVGPAFGLPADNMNWNVIIGNYIEKNLADSFDTATPGPVGINISSGDGGSPIRGTVVAYNIIREEAVDIAVNTPADVDIHLNDLGGRDIGIADVCALDKASICTGTIHAAMNYWGCDDGPGSPECSSVSGSNISFTPWLRQPPHEEDDRGRR